METEQALDEPVLDAAGAAALLRVSTKTVLRLARGGEIPARKIGREWRFARAALMDHLAKVPSG
jgi:excisionase family DNA binding protein